MAPWEPPCAVANSAAKNFDLASRGIFGIPCSWNAGIVSQAFMIRLMIGTPSSAGWFAGETSKARSSLYMAWTIDTKDTSAIESSSPTEYKPADSCARNSKAFKILTTRDRAIEDGSRPSLLFMERRTLNLCRYAVSQAIMAARSLALHRRAMSITGGINGIQLGYESSR